MVVIDDPEELDLIRLLRAGDHVVCSQGLAEPATLCTRLLQQRHAIGPLDLFVGPSYSDTFRPEHGDTIAFRSYCGTAANGALIEAGVLDVVPAHYADLPRLYASGALRCDVALLMASEADGRFNLGLSNDYAIEAARRARVVLIEASDRFPWTFGAELPADITVHAVLRTHREPHSFGGARAAPQAAEREIARRVAELIPDGATLEVGIGALPDLVLDALRGHRELGIHSAVFSDAVVELVEAGVVTNHRKPIDRGVSVAGIIIGGQKVCRFAHRNPALRLMPNAYTHGFQVLSALPDFYALNGAIEIDLGGQVNAETMNGRYVGAVGGQVDLVRGGNASPGGRSIIMLPSTARGGGVSRIVPRLTDGIVTTPRSDVDCVVTEWGVAELRGKSQRERARALMALAHPDHRDALERAAHSLFSARRAGP